MHYHTARSIGRYNHQPRLVILHNKKSYHTFLIYCNNFKLLVSDQISSNTAKTRSLVTTLCISNTLLHHSRRLSSSLGHRDSLVPYGPFQSCDNAKGSHIRIAVVCRVFSLFLSMLLYASTMAQRSCFSTQSPTEDGFRQEGTTQWDQGP